MGTDLLTVGGGDENYSKGYKDIVWGDNKKDDTHSEMPVEGNLTYSKVEVNEQVLLQMKISLLQDEIGLLSSLIDCTHESLYGEKLTDINVKQMEIYDGWKSEGV